MTDLEERVRQDLDRAAARIRPSGDAWAENRARVRRDRSRRRLAAVACAGTVAAAVAAGSLLLPGQLSGSPVTPANPSGSGPTVYYAAFFPLPTGAPESAPSPLPGGGPVPTRVKTWTGTGLVRSLQAQLVARGIDASVAALPEAGLLEIRVVGGGVPKTGPLPLDSGQFQVVAGTGRTLVSRDDVTAAKAAQRASGWTVVLDVRPAAIARFRTYVDQASQGPAPHRGFAISYDAQVMSGTVGGVVASNHLARTGGRHGPGRLDEVVLTRLSQARAREIAAVLGHPQLPNYLWVSGPLSQAPSRSPQAPSTPTKTVEVGAKQVRVYFHFGLLCTRGGGCSGSLDGSASHGVTGIAGDLATASWDTDSAYVELRDGRHVALRSVSNSLWPAKVFVLQLTSAERAQAVDIVAEDVNGNVLSRTPSPF